MITKSEEKLPGVHDETSTEDAVKAAIGKSWINNLHSKLKSSTGSMRMLPDITNIFSLLATNEISKSSDQLAELSFNERPFDKSKNELIKTRRTSMSPQSSSVEKSYPISQPSETPVPSFYNPHETESGASVKTVTTSDDVLNRS